MHWIFKIFSVLLILGTCLSLYYQFSLLTDNTSVYVASLTHSFPLLITADSVCRSERRILIVVHSFEGNFVRRDIIRQSYGAKEWREKFGYEVLFATGRSSNRLYGKWLREEADIYGDVLQGDFYDDYRMLTAMMWLRYTAKYCTQFSFVMHLDDDIVIDVFSIMHNFFWADEKPSESTIYCLARMNEKMEVIRSSDSEWYIPESIYPSALYPTFCAGAAYVMPMAIVPTLKAKLEQMDYMHVDDALITGIARNAVGIAIKQVLPSFIFATPPYVVLAAFYERETTLAECTERCTMEVWKMLLSQRRDPKKLVPLRIISPEEELQT